MTYGVKGFFVITPLDDQRMLAERIILHWTNGYGARYNIDRKEAFKITDIARSLEEAIDKIREIARRNVLSKGVTPALLI